MYCTVLYHWPLDCEAQRGGTIIVFALEIPSSGGPLRVLKYTPHLQPVDVKHRSCWRTPNFTPLHFASATDLCPRNVNCSSIVTGAYRELSAQSLYQPHLSTQDPRATVLFTISPAFWNPNYSSEPFPPWFKTLLTP